jgi:predicted transcriptional regulator
MDEDQPTMIGLTADVVAAYVSYNNVGPSDLSDLVTSVHNALSVLGETPKLAPAEPIKLTAAQIRKSITPDALISFEDGRPYKMLKRHLARHGLTMDAYKAKWSLPDDYPATAPAYSEVRSAMARSVGLGRKDRRGPADAAVSREIGQDPEA